MGFEPTRAEPIGLAVQRLNLSATSSSKLSANIFHVRLECEKISVLKINYFCVFDNGCLKHLCMVLITLLNENSVVCHHFLIVKRVEI
jgi:hypothetical protein